MSSRANEVFGAGDVDALFHGNPTTPVPWPTAPRSRTHRTANDELVYNAVTNPDRFETRAVDPRSLHATQPGLVRAATSHYMSGDYERTGETYADQNNSGNRQPVVFHDLDSGRNVLMSGHHRGAAHLLRGEQFNVLWVPGHRATHADASAFQRRLIDEQRQARQSAR